MCGTKPSPKPCPKPGEHAQTGQLAKPSFDQMCPDKTKKRKQGQAPTLDRNAFLLIFSTNRCK